MNKWCSVINLVNLMSFFIQGNIFLDKKIEELLDELQKANDLLKSRHRGTFNVIFPLSFFN